VNCDPIAGWYRWLEYIGFGGALQRRRTAFLRDVADARRILVLGEGDGRFLVRLVEQNGSAAIDYVDLSERMLQLARERAGSERVHFHRGDALKIPLPEGEYDLVCTHFFLDCLNDQNAAVLVDRVARASAPGARWLVSEFREAGMWRRAIVGVLYWFFRLTTGLQTRRVVDYRPLLTQRGFQLVRQETARLGLLISELWARS
jgi:ubiquinone/menaquinone biosynthesis C-methylase UbiE